MNGLTTGTVRRVALGVALTAAIASGMIDRPQTNVEIRRATGPVQRLLGPVASVASSIEWVRYRVALDQGDEARAYGRAARALALDARTVAGWATLGDHFIFTRASPLEVSEPADRRRWIRAGLELMRRGEEHVAAPGELAFMAAVLRATYLAGIPDESLGWPGGPSGLLREARVDLERATEYGHPGVPEVLDFIDHRMGEITTSGR